MDEDEYAIVSKKEFLTLKREIERLKKNPLEGSEHGETLQSSIDNLNRSLNTMLEVFKQAADDMKLEEHDTELVSKQMGPISDKLDTLIDQNQKIAKGIVAVADMVREKLEELEEKSRPRLAPLSAPKPKSDLPGPMPPPPSGFGMPPSGPGMPSQGFGGSFGMPPSGPGMPPPGMGRSPPGMQPPGAQPPGMPPMPDLPPLDEPSGREIMGGLMK